MMKREDVKESDSDQF